MRWMIGELGLQRASNDAPSRHALYVLIERMGGRHIGEGLSFDRLVEACCVSHYLAQLASCDVVTWAEGVVVIPGDYASGFSKLDLVGRA